MATIKPTFKDPISPQSEKFEKDFKKTMIKTQAPMVHESDDLNEVDNMLNEKEQSLKKKIFSLAKMESLVFADPKLSAVYNDMAENGEEKYGYHYNETIQNMIFNDYVLNSPTYLQKYKMAIPKEKKRRDKSGINSLKKAGAEKMAQTGLPKQKKKEVSEEKMSVKSTEDHLVDVIDKIDDLTLLAHGKAEEEIEESTSAGSAAGGSSTYTGYAGPSAWGKEGDLSGDFKKSNKGNTGKAKPINKPISKVISIGESKKNYITDPTAFKKYFERLDEGTSISQGDGGGGYESPVGFKDDVKNVSKQLDTEAELKDLDTVRESMPGQEKRAYGKHLPSGKNVSSATDTPVENKEVKKPYYEGGKITSPFGTGKENVSGTVIAKHSQPERLQEGYNRDMYSTKDDLNQLIKSVKERTGKGITRNHIPMLAGEALYTLAVKLAGQYAPLGWDDLPDTNSMWDYIDENGGMTYDQLVAGVKEAVNDRLSEEGFSLDDMPGELAERAKSKSQQRFMGMVNAYKNGELDGEASPEIERAADSMTDTEVDDFASTKHKGLPEKINEFDPTWGGSSNVGPKTKGERYWQFDKDIKQVPGFDRLVQDFTRTKKINQEIVAKIIADNPETPREKIMGYVNYLPNAMDDWKNSDDPINEDTQTMIQNNGTSMSNKAQATGDMSSEVPQGAQQTGGLNESDMKLFEDINKELEAFSIHQDKLKLMSENKKTPSMVQGDRLRAENPKNFKKDFKDSDTKDVIDVEKELMWKDQQTDVGKDPMKLGTDIEKQEIKVADMKGDEALKNVGNSTNEDGDEVPKRNLTTKEQEEVNLYRNGQHSLTYDNEPDDEFIARMKADQGEFFEMGEKQKEFKGQAPMYEKDDTFVTDAKVDKVQYDKNVKRKGDKVAWNERMGLGSNVKLSESMVTGRFIDVLGNRRLMEFRLNEVALVETVDDDTMSLSFDGLGNTYMNKSVDKKVIVNEAVSNAMESHKFFTNGKDVFAVKNPTQSLNEGAVIEDKPVMNEQMDKMKHLLGYNPETFVSTKGVKKNRKF